MHQVPDHPSESHLLAVIRVILKENPSLFASHESDAGCFMRALRLGEPTFTLRAQDESAAGIVDTWLARNPQLSEERKMQTATRSREMQSWPTKKAAD